MSPNQFREGLHVTPGGADGEVPVLDAQRRPLFDRQWEMGRFPRGPIPHYDNRARRHETHRRIRASRNLSEAS